MRPHKAAIHQLKAEKSDLDSKRKAKAIQLKEIQKNEDRIKEELEDIKYNSSAFKEEVSNSNTTTTMLIIIYSFNQCNFAKE